MAMDEQRFGKYRLLRRLAFGGMAEIFLAQLERDAGFAKKVVIKRILPHLGADTDFVSMFQDEARLAANLNHPNVVQVYDFGAIDGTYFIAMEYVEGADLRRLLKGAADRKRPLSPAEVAALGEGVARGLAHAHALTDDASRPLEIVHRDVSPHNVMVSRTGEAKIMDFGIAKATARATRTATGTIKGKLAYMAPEQAGGGTVDKLSDQFAVGLVLWECLTLRRVYEGDSEPELLARVTRAEIPDVRSVRSDVPDALAAIVQRMLAREREARFGDLLEVEQQLAAFRFSLGAAGAVRIADMVAQLAPAEPSTPVRRVTMALPDPAPAATPAAQGGAESSAEPPAGVTQGSSGWTLAPEPGAATATVSPPRESTAPSEVSPPAVSTRPAPPSSRRRWLAAVAGGVLAGVAAVALVASRRAPPQQQQASVPPAKVATAMVDLDSAPSGARLLVDGVETGLVTPTRVPRPEGSQALLVQLDRPGYLPWTRRLTAEDGDRVFASLSREPEAAHSDVHGKTEHPRTVEPVERPRRARGGQSAGRKPPSAAPEATAVGRLSLRADGPWVEVYLGTRKLGATPLNQVEVPAGTLELRLVNPRVGIDRRVRINVPAGGEVRQTLRLP